MGEINQIILIRDLRNVVLLRLQRKTSKVYQVEQKFTKSAIFCETELKRRKNYPVV